MTRIAVIGAGLSGLVAARELDNLGDITVFEKSRGYGGRMATRYEQDFEFDHGAQFFTARTSAFKTYLKPLIGDGVVACWHARFAEFDDGQVSATRNWDDVYPHYVGAPRMSAIGRYLADGLTIRLNATVAELRREADGWSLADSNGTALGRFDWVVSSVPAAQTAALMPAGAALQRVAAVTRMHACFALMLGFNQPLSLPWQAALVRGADISWVSVNSSKPGRRDDFTLVVHSTNAYAECHIDHELKQVQKHLVNEASNVIGFDCSASVTKRLQRWRYANVDKQEGASFSIDPELRIAACGDWFRRGRVEAAFTSGYELAVALRGLLA